MNFGIKCLSWPLTQPTTTCTWTPTSEPLNVLPQNPGKLKWLLQAVASNCIKIVWDQEV